MKKPNIIWWLEIIAIIVCVIVIVVLVFCVPYKQIKKPVIPAVIVSNTEAIDLATNHTIAVVRPPPILIVSNTFPPSVSYTPVWPDGAIPTKIIHVPDSQQSAKGLMELNLHPKDDIEIDFEPRWTFTLRNKDNYVGYDTAIDDGNGFKSLKEYTSNRDSDTASTNAWWLKLRILRIHLATNRQSASCTLLVKEFEPPHPLPPVPPQVFGDLAITYEGIRSLPDRKMLVYLTFWNVSPANTLGVAMRAGLPRGVQYNLESSLVASDGTPYVVDIHGTTGINAVRTNPQQLTTIEPREKLKASLTFEPRGILSDNVKSVRLQAEVVVNYNYSRSQYVSYRETRQDVLPPYCKIVNMVFDIPIKP